MQPSPASTSRPVRWAAPALILLLAAAVIAFCHFSERVESYVAAYAISAVSAVAFLALLVWFARFSGFDVRTRRVGTGAVIALVIVTAAVVQLTTRVEGVFNGTGFPRRVWRWSPHADSQLPPIHSAHQAINLTATRAGDFPEFLGPGRRNAVTGAGLARQWTQPPRLLWREPIGAGWSSFAATGPWAFTQEQRGDQELVVCYEVATGRPQWVHADDGTRFVDSQGGDGPRATPTIDGGRVFTMGATGILNCLDGSSGTAIWSQHVVAGPRSNLTYGKSCSPLIVDGLVAVTGGRGGPSLLAYRASDGMPRWTAGNESPGYASPVLATLCGVRQIVTVNAASVTAHDPADGRLLWRFDWPGSMPKNIQPIPLDGDRLLISAGYGLGTTLLKVTSAGGTLAARAFLNLHGGDLDKFVG